MVKHKYLNYAHIAKEHPECFEIMLFFNPQPVQKSMSTEKEGVIKAYPQQELDNVIGISLPAPLCLMMISQLQILNTQRFGTLLADTFIKQGRHQKLQIQSSGASYLEHLTPEELQKIESWFASVCSMLWQQLL